MNVGDIVDDLLGMDHMGQEVRLSQYDGRYLVLYFYPKDNTAGCTAQACSLRDGYAALQAAGYAVVGVSKDSERSHHSFIAKHNLPFRLIVDVDAALSQHFGVWKEKSMYGRRYMGVERTTFVIDASTRSIKHVLRGRDIMTAEHARQILLLPR
ncbi:MAG: peroxiredoxin [Porphyromonadaceae bacterium]|nr:peroxiredoxin [Porphyromonadaceae bacterium]